MSGTLQNPGRANNAEPSREPLRSQARVAVVSRRLWPLTGEAERDVLQLATSLQEVGVQPTLITPRWQKNWSETSMLRGIAIRRLPWPAAPGWGLLRYLYSLSRYLRQYRHEFDSVIVQGLRGEAYTALTSLPPNIMPVILRASEAGPYGEVAWQRQSRFGPRIAAKCQHAQAIVAASSFVAEELHSAGYNTERIHVFPPGVDSDCAVRNEETRELARHAVAGVNHDLVVVGGAPVAVCISPLQRDRGLELMIRSWVPIQAKWPHARLWIIGDGPERESLFRLLCDLDLRYRVCLPGSFDHWEDLLQAADIYLAPAPHPTSSSAVREALACGLAVVASDQAGHRALITRELNGLLYSATERGSLTNCLFRLITAPDLAWHLGQAARVQSSQLPIMSEAIWLRQLLAADRRHS